MSKNKEYWMCIIGPIEKYCIPKRGDLPLRASVQQTYFDMLNESAKICASGWGMNQEKYELIQKAWSMDVEELKNKLNK
jgi:hypothetical protein